MAPPLIANYQAFYQPGITQIYAVTSMANYLSPTRAELDAGTNLTRQVRGVGDWSYEADVIDRQDMSNTFTPTIGGRTKASKPSLDIYCGRNGVDARQLLYFGWNGFMVMLDGGDVAGYKMDVWPVQVIAKPKNRGDSDPLTITFSFSVPQAPAEDVAIPA